jgi:hypothetical protein
MMLGQMVAKESRFVGVLQHLESLLVDITYWDFIPLDPVEDAELNGYFRE